MTHAQRSKQLLTGTRLSEAGDVISCVAAAHNWMPEHSVHRVDEPQTSQPEIALHAEAAQPDIEQRRTAGGVGASGGGPEEGGAPGGAP